MRLAILCSVLYVSALMAQTTSVLISGTPGSGIGNTTFVATAPDWELNAFAWSGVYTVSPPSLPSEVTFFFRRSLGEQLTLQFSGIGGGDEWGFLNMPLSIGFYERATRIPSFVAAHPAMYFGMNSSSIAYGPNALSGRFVVLAADFNNPRVNRFAAKFSFVDDTHPLGSISGTIRHNFEPTNTISLSSTTAATPTAITADITLTSPAPAGGALVELSTNDPDTVGLPASIVIPAGEQHATVPIEVQLTATSHDVDILSTYNGAADVATLTVISPVSRVTAVDVQGDEKSLLPGAFHAGSDALYVTNTYYGIEHLKFECLDPSWVWDFDFDVGSDRRIAPGVFPVTGQQVKPFPATGFLPSLFISRRPATSNVGGGDFGVGSFQVSDIAIDESYDPPKLLRFMATYDVVIGSGHVRGSILYNEGPPGKHRAVHK